LTGPGSSTYNPPIFDLEKGIKMAVKMSVNLPDEAVDNLRQIAEKNGITLTAALRQAIANEKFLEDELRNDAKLLIEDKNKAVRQVVFSK
jgi:hypothetical protein